ncbi:uncharacterized protein BDV14DRAFT_46342 [Aspergillus stella-maris]|uniref:uncharacterized protein n=1 Tax=Aspergillus stella-maris TaxID=1810926 RepID=UPI003CCE4A57
MLLSTAPVFPIVSQVSTLATSPTVSAGSAGAGNWTQDTAPVCSLDAHPPSFSTTCAFDPLSFPSPSFPLPVPESRIA